jgi:hypothetical protein
MLLDLLESPSLIQPQGLELVTVILPFGLFFLGSSHEFFFPLLA